MTDDFKIPVPENLGTSPQHWEDRAKHLKKITLENNREGERLSQIIGRKINVGNSRFELFLDFIVDLDILNGIQRLEFEIKFQTLIQSQLLDLNDQVKDAQAKANLGVHPSQTASLVDRNGRPLSSG